NKLALVHDAVNAGNFSDDIDDQVAGLTNLSFPTYSLGDETTHNYRYDAIGQLVQDKTEEIENIEWTVTGKVKKIERYAFSEKPDLAFDYDPMGRRIMKIVYPKSAPGVINTEGITKTYYVRDAQGNVMSIYTLKTEDSEKNLYLRERMLYGSTRLGMEQVNQIVASTEPTNIDINTAQQRVVGDKRYEMQNHLNSVMVTVTDRKLPEYNATENLAYYKPDVVSYSDFLPFGKLSPNRHGGEMGRIGFQGQEKDDEIKGEGNSINYKYRMHDPRVGRFFSEDPLSPDYPYNSPYAFSENVVLNAIELEGLEKVYKYNVWYDGSGVKQSKFSHSELDMKLNTDVRIYRYFDAKGNVERTVSQDLGRSNWAKTGDYLAEVTGQKQWIDAALNAKAEAEAIGASDGMKWEAIAGSVIMADKMSGGFFNDMGLGSRGPRISRPKSTGIVRTTIKIDAKKYPESAKHIKDSQKSGHPSILTVNRGGANANRKASLKGTSTIRKMDRDEYPPAVFQEGGAGASVRHISSGDNRGAGSSMGNQLRGVKNGEKVKLEVINDDN